MINIFKIWQFIKKYGYIFAIIFLFLLIENLVDSYQKEKLQKQLIESEVKRAVIQRDIFYQLELARKDSILSAERLKRADNEKKIIDSISKSIETRIRYKYRDYLPDEAQKFFDTITRKSTLKMIEW